MNNMHSRSYIVRISVINKNENTIGGKIGMKEQNIPYPFNILHDLGIKNIGYTDLDKLMGCIEEIVKDASYWPLYKDLYILGHDYQETCKKACYNSIQEVTVFHSHILKTLMSYSYLNVNHKQADVHQTDVLDLPVNDIYLCLHQDFLDRLCQIRCYSVRDVLKRLVTFNSVGKSQLFSNGRHGLGIEHGYSYQLFCETLSEYGIMLPNDQFVAISERAFRKKIEERGADNLKRIQDYKDAQVCMRKLKELLMS